MNKKYIKYVQDIIGTELANNPNLNTDQIKKLLSISGDLEIMKNGLYP